MIVIIPLLVPLQSIRLKHPSRRRTVAVWPVLSNSVDLLVGSSRRDQERVSVSDMEDPEENPLSPEERDEIEKTFGPGAPERIIDAHTGGVTLKGRT